MTDINFVPYSQENIMRNSIMVRTVFTTAEAAKKLGYTVQHTRLLIRKNKLAAQKIGRDWLISNDDLFAFKKVYTKQKIEL